MKKACSVLIALVMMFSVLAVPCLAYKPEYEGMEDIRWFGGYDPASGLSVLSDKPNGVQCTFKYDANAMWANRIVAGWDYNLSATDVLKAGKKPDYEGVYIRLEDLKWDIPKATPSKPNPEPSIMITITATQGGWSDSRSLMFWIIRGKNEQYRMAVLRGVDANEKNVNQFAMDYKEFSEPIKNEINFYFRRTSSSEWTLNVNNNVFKFDDKTIVSERFVEMNPLAVSLGTWNSGGAVAYTVSEIWNYGCFDYGKKANGKYVVNPAPAFVETVRKTPPKTTAATKNPQNTTTKAPTKNPSAATTQVPAGGSETTQSPGITDGSAHDTDVNAGETLTTAADALAGTDTTAADTAPQEKASNWVVWLLVAIIVIVLIGGGAAFYFLFVKKKDTGAPKE